MIIIIKKHAWVCQRHTNQDFLSEPRKNVSRSNFTCGEVQKSLSQKQYMCFDRWRKIRECSFSLSQLSTFYCSRGKRTGKTEAFGLMVLRNQIRPKAVCGDGRQLTFPRKRMGAYWRWVLNRVNTVSYQIPLPNGYGVGRSILSCCCHILHMDPVHNVVYPKHRSPLCESDTN